MTEPRGMSREGGSHVREAASAVRAPHRSLVAAAAVSLVLAIALSIAAAGDGTFAFDLRISQAVQRHTFPGSRLVELFGYAVGSSAVLIPLGIAAALWLFYRRQPAMAWLFAGVVVLRPLNTLLKLIIDSPRPAPDQLDVLRQSGGNGFPSGHVTGTLVMAGAVFYLTPRLTGSRRARALLRVLAVVAVIATSYSRVASGAHWPSDVLGGLLWGTTELLLLIAVVGWLSRRARAG